MLTLTVAAESWFSCELEGSMASLLGTGVALEDFLFFLSCRELDFVVSWRHEEREGVVLVLVFWWLTLAVAGVVVVDFEGAMGDDLAKKPRMLCCFRVAVEGGFVDSGVFAGVRVSPIVNCTMYTRRPK